MHVPFGAAGVETECALWRLPRGTSAVIVGFDEPMPAAYSSRLTEMGFHAGETVTCLLRPAFGCPRVYRVGNTVYSLDRDLAEHIRVAVDG